MLTNPEIYSQTFTNKIMKKIDPFTRTPGVAGAAFINMHYADEIIENLESDYSSKYIIKPLS